MIRDRISSRSTQPTRPNSSPQSALIAMGYAGMLTAQVAVNVGMCLYVFPVVGLTQMCIRDRRGIIPPPMTT